MGRRAVQGYPEKSYYENTRYLGMITTTDALNEGVFRILSNFKISDTGQSLEPRDGFITSSLRIGEANPIFISNKSIVFADDDKTIVYDFKNATGYLVDLSATTDKYIPAIRIINTRLDRLPYQDAPNTLVQLFAGMDLLEEGRASYFFDEYGVKHALLRVSFGTDVYTLLLQYNDKTDCLNMSFVDYNQHPSYLTHLRNIANGADIIPDPMQVFYNTNNRPDGVVNNVGLTYVKDIYSGMYVVGYVSSSTAYWFIPNFYLDLPHYVKPGADAWAMCAEVTSTSVDKNFDTTRRTPWIDTATRKNIFNYNLDGKDVNAEINLTSSNFANRHYKSAQTVVTLVKKDIHERSPEFLFNAEGRKELFQRTPNGYTSTSFFSKAVASERQLHDKIVAIRTVAQLKEFIEFAGNEYMFYVGSVAKEQDDFTTRITDISNYDNFESYTYAGTVVGVPVDAAADYRIINTASMRENYFLVSSGDGEITASSLDETLYKDVNDKFLSATKLFELVDNGSVHLPICFKILSIKARCVQYAGGKKYPYYVYMPARYLNGFYFSSGGAGYQTLTGGQQHIHVTGDDTLYYAFEDTLIFMNSVELRKRIDANYFVDGYNVRFYFVPYNKAEITAMFNPDDPTAIKFADILLAKARMFVEAGALLTTVANVPYPRKPGDITYIQRVYDDHVDAITKGSNFAFYNNERMVVWSGNRLYISEPGKIYYYKEDMMFTFDEQIVKVIQFREILLVFTVQHLYAVYQQVVENPDGVVTFWAQQRVLYNILTDPKYADAIKVFNQMVLFYSSDGQLFLIKPSTVIDSETRFSLQYLNKSANDFLANYDVYINGRLVQYGRHERIHKEDVQITTSVSINYLKIYYSVPGVITMILCLDVLNNRFFFYDTLSFTNIYDKMFIDGSEVLFTRTNNLTLFTRNHKDNYDMNLLTDFRKDPVYCLLDTGNINLNNHLRKRFRDLRVTFKNINAERVNYTLETWVDSIVVKPAYDNVLKVSNLDGRSTYVEELDDTAVDMINKDKLLDFSNYMSNALLSHRTNILSIGKVLRLCMSFKSTGKYKVYDFGIIYKERRM